MAMPSGKGAGGVGQGMQNHPGLGGLLTENPILPAAQLSLGVYGVLVEPGPPPRAPPAACGYRQNSLLPLGSHLSSPTWQPVQPLAQHLERVPTEVCVCVCVWGVGGCISRPVG